MSRSAYLQDQGTRSTPQSEPIPGSTQVPNSAGGYSWQVDDWTRMHRFLVLGSEGGSYYATQRDLTRENVASLRRCIDADGPRAVALIVSVSEGGRAPRNTEAIFALAVAASVKDAATRSAALDALPRVCRIGTHMFQFLGFVEQFRGWGRSLRRGVGQWYAGMEPDRLAYQLVKYQEREGWRHRDALRLAHPARQVSLRNPTVEVTDAHAALFDWVKRDDRARVELPDTAPASVRAYLAAQNAKTPKDTVKLIEEFGGALPREAIQSEHLNTPEVWHALLDVGMPMTALIRNLATMTRNGVLKPLDKRTAAVAEQIANEDALKKARVHPLAILFALATYNAGHGFRGGNTWTPIQAITDALDAAFYAAFDNVEPTGKRHLLGLDVSGSMNGPIANSMLSCMEGAVAMSMVTDRVEPATHVMGFDNGLRDLRVSSRMRLDSAIASLPRNYGGTDCSLPMRWARDRGVEVDTFVVYTDNETWAGRPHPAQALQQYREATGIPAKLIVVGMIGNSFSVADPNDAGMLDVVGFDTSTPAVMADFART